MKLGLFGGSFDPIHRGHVEPVLDALRALGLRRVIFLPTAQPPHKRNRDLSPAAARYAMTELALLDHLELHVDAFEMRADAPQYTIDTVRHFRARFPEARLHYLIGADSLPELPRWREAEELLATVELIVLARPGWSADASLAPLTVAERSLLAGARIHRVENRLYDISSTELRDRLRRDPEAASPDLDPRVLMYIVKYGLYPANDA